MVEPVNLFTIANKQAEWLSVRQKVVASNVANVNTPDYKARDVQDFKSVLEDTPIKMAVTNAAHIDVSGDGLELSRLNPEDVVEITHSGNDVNLEDEMQKGGAISRDMSLNTSVVKVFHRMLLSTVRGGSA